MVLNNGTLLKQYKIILPHSLHEKVIRLTHNGSHPGQNALKRPSRNHFYIKDLDIKVTKYFPPRSRRVKTFFLQELNDLLLTR